MLKPIWSLSVLPAPYDSFISFYFFTVLRNLQQLFLALLSEVYNLSCEEQRLPLDGCLHQSAEVLHGNSASMATTTEPALLGQWLQS